MRRSKIKKNKYWHIYKLAILFFIVSSSLMFFFLFFTDGRIISPLSSTGPDYSSSEMEKKLYSAGLGFSSIKIASDSSYVVVLSDGGKAIITPRKNINEQISSLQVVLNRLTIEGKKVKVIDFRFDKPVIRL